MSGDALNYSNFVCPFRSSSINHSIMSGIVVPYGLEVPCVGPKCMAWKHQGTIDGHGCGKCALIPECEERTVPS